MGIKTSMLSYSGTNGCFPAITALPPGPPISTRQAWGNVLPFVPTATLCQPAGVFVGVFDDIGFIPSGNVYYQYAVAPQPTAATLPLLPGTAAGAGRNACVAIAVIPVGVGAAANAGFQVVSLGNLDGDPNFSNFSADDATGATDCTPGIF